MAHLLVANTFLKPLSFIKNAIMQINECGKNFLRAVLTFHFIIVIVFNLVINLWAARCIRVKRELSE